MYFILEAERLLGQCSASGMLPFRGNDFSALSWRGSGSVLKKTIQKYFYYLSPLIEVILYFQESLRCGEDAN